MKQAGDTFFIYYVEEGDPVYGDNVIVGILLLPQNDGWVMDPDP